MFWLSWVTCVLLQVSVSLQTGSMRVAMREGPVETVLMEGELTHKINTENSLWSLEPGCCVLVRLPHLRNTTGAFHMPLARELFTRDTRTIHVVNYAHCSQETHTFTSGKNATEATIHQLLCTPLTPGSVGR